MVADLIAQLGAGLLHHRLRGGVDARLDQIELHPGRDQRHHHLEADCLAGAFPASHRGLEIARDCISAISGYAMASRQPRNPASD